MELLIAILFALNVLVSPGMTPEQIMEKYPAAYSQAQNIMDTQTYTIDEQTGIVIVEDGSGD
jgi:hypothetical protein